MGLGGRTDQLEAAAKGGVKVRTALRKLPVASRNFNDISHNRTVSVYQEVLHK